MPEFPRVTLAHAPTPLERMERLGAEIGLNNLYVKRDDCTGLAMGGNKARQLEYYFGEAVAAGADVVLITGAVQSNFMRMTAAAAAKLGMACHVQLEDRVHDMPADYHASGNVLLDRLFGATIHTYPEGEDEAGADRALEALADELRGQGRTPYIVYLSANHPPVGALGYRDAALEMLDQAAAMGLDVAKVIVPSGSALTHAGTLVGLRECNAEIECIGMCVRRAAELQHPRVLARAGELAVMIDRDGLITAADVRVEDVALGPGYGHPGEDALEAMGLCARLEGLLLDPVYSAKALAGLIALARAGEIGTEEAVVFIHTGGTPALFGYAELLNRTFA